MLQPTTPTEEVINHNVVKTEAKQGPILKIGEWQLNWKAQGANTGYSFSIYETTLGAGNGLPLHKHPYPEFFYLLEGSLAFCRWNNAGAAEWIQCETGDSILAPPNAPHTFFNKSALPARFLSVSTYHHERMLKDAINPGGDLNYLPSQLSTADFEQLFKSMEKDQVYVVADHA
ncbi:hypothetical protein ACPOL_0604 [Acidisarcina polymorpha]|uniref:Cupin type-2 domain-containing protein n=1 Tax=Acidisarcina polymorpha TaxID=2211140 RepID=A0A2Z5FU71_9BACT|nr:cupin domain-containing protein [Acidisarcina polymorpha]AXC09975.1 hypothetical protein ACPOL_0604 [Acidisarcina polymorpha]